MKIILISGKAEAGKTTTAQYLKDIVNYAENGERDAAIVPYGQYVKDTAKMLFGWDGVKDEAGRNLLQVWGTNIVRHNDPNFWVDTVQRLAFVCRDMYDYFIIDDARFPNEIESWKNRVFNLPWDEVITIRVERPGWENSLTEEQRQHPSETSLDDYNFDITISATNIEELYREIIDKVVPNI